MATQADLDNLKARYSAVCAELAAMGPTKAGGLPDSQASGIGHVAYRKSLVEEQRALREEIAAVQSEVDGGPWEFPTEGLC